MNTKGNYSLKNLAAVLAGLALLAPYAARAAAPEVPADKAVSVPADKELAPAGARGTEELDSENPAPGEEAVETEAGDQDEQGVDSDTEGDLELEGIDEIENEIDEVENETEAEFEDDDKGEQIEAEDVEAAEAAEPDELTR